MKLAAISDIHSNIQALEKVLGEIEEEDPRHILCLGDVVGYGADPNKVVQRLKELENLVCIKGNHDEAVVTGNTAGMNPQASRAVEWTVEELEDSNLKFLEELPKYKPIRLDDLDFFLVHGSPENYLDEYIYEKTANGRFETFFEETEADVILMAHTHIPYVKKFGGKTAANPGSVGQPRDRDRRAAFAVIDTGEMDIDIRRVFYGVEEAAEAIKRSKLPDGLGERLYYGR